MRNPTEVLKSLAEKSKDELYRFKRLYRNLYNPEFYWLAYKNIYANDGSMTAGADGTTIDGMSNEKINEIIASLRDHSYRPKPAKRAETKAHRRGKALVWNRRPERLPYSNGPAGQTAHRAF